MELGIRLSFVKTSEFRGGWLNHPPPPTWHAPSVRDQVSQPYRATGKQEYSPMYQLVYDQQVMPHSTEPPDLYPHPQSSINQSAHNLQPANS
jgi:hypothetical protein